MFDDFYSWLSTQLVYINSVRVACDAHVERIRSKNYGTPM